MSSSILAALLLVPSQLRSLAGKTPLVVSSAAQKSDESKPQGNVDGKQNRKQGFGPNVEWKAISMDDLRSHPLFHELPSALDLELPLNLGNSWTERSTADAREVLQLFRQDSWQWDALHAGRLTTSKAASCLGFYEETAGKVLDCPRSLRGHGKVLSAWSELRVEPCSLPRFCSHHRKQKKELRGDNNALDSSSVWVEKKRAGERGGRFLHTPRQGTQVRAQDGRRYYHSSVGSVRMAWGNAQEPTALLNVLNAVDGAEEGEQTSKHADVEETGRDCCSDYERAAVLLGASRDAAKGFCKETKSQVFGRPKLLESGLRMLELVEAPPAIARLWQCKNSENITNASGTSANLLLVGASPDGILEYPNGSLSVVEVKNHAPFQIIKNSGSRTTRANASRKGRQGFEVFDRGPMTTIGAWHVAQLQLEMLCTGPKCRTAIFGSCSATCGLHLFEVKRDDEYLYMMLAFLRVFHDRYITKQNHMYSSSMPPPLDFFTVDPPDLLDGARYGLREGDYDRFLKKTKSIAQTARIWKAVPEVEMQRSGLPSAPFWDSRPKKVVTGVTATRATESVSLVSEKNIPKKRKQKSRRKLQKKKMDRTAMEIEGEDGTVAS